MFKTAAAAKPSTSAISIRPARLEDKEFILELSERVEATGAPHWRQDGPNPYTTDWIDHILQNNPQDQAILIAESEDGVALGYSWILILTEFDANIPHGHIAGIGVSPAAESRGVGAQLVQAGEDWCRGHGLSEVTLHCYIANERAHHLYSRLGFENEWYHMRKGLS